MMNNGNYGTNISVFLEDDTEVIITKVHYYKGCNETLTQPGEPEEIEILAAEYADGTKIENWDDLLEDIHYEQVEEGFGEEQQDIY